MIAYRVPIEAAQIPAAQIEYAELSPLLIVAAAAIVGLIVEAAVPRSARFISQIAVASVGLIAAAVATVWVYRSLPVVESLAGAVGRGFVGAEGALAVDGPAVVTWGILLLFGFLGLLLFAERQLEGGLSAFTGRAADVPGSDGEKEAINHRLEHTEVFPLLMFALSGMMLFAASNDLITMFVALEVLSLPLYVLVGLARRRRLLSQEAALKYFLLGAFASVFFLYGAALAYGYSGSLNLTEIDRAVSARGDADALLLGAMALIAVGLLFKIGAVPFHSWTPDAYQGAPTPVTAFMAAATKAAAIVALLRVFFVGFGGASWDWRPTMWVLAVISMLVGSVIAAVQQDVKRMLAYSSVAHAGFLLVGVAAAESGQHSDGLIAIAAPITSLSSVLFYLVAYGVATIGAFAVVTMVRDATGETTNLSQWAGLGKTSPLLAAAFTLFMLSFAGIPLTAGFIGKWAVFAAAWAGGLWVLVVIGVLASAIAAFFYLRIVVVMYFGDPPTDGPTVAHRAVLTTVVLAVAAIGTVLWGVFPGPLLELVGHAGAFVR